MNTVNVDGMTPLMLASSEGHEHSLLTLLQSGARINPISATGQTALALARTTEVAQRLLQAGGKKSEIPLQLKAVLDPKDVSHTRKGRKGKERLAPGSISARQQSGSAASPSRRACTTAALGRRPSSPAARGGSPILGAVVVRPEEADEGIDFLKVHDRA